MAKRLNLGEIELTSLSLQMADRSMTSPKGIIEDVLIKVDKFIFLVHFVVLDMKDHEKVPLILGRPFLATSRALINVESGELTLRVGDEKVQLSIYQNDKLLKKENEGCMRVEAIRMHGVGNMKVATKETTMKSLSGNSPDEKQWVQELNSSIKSNVNQNEMEISLKTVDVKHLSIEGTKKSTAEKTKKIIHKTSIQLKILISACMGTLNQKPMSHSPS